MSDYSYKFYNLLSRQFVGELPLSDVSFNDPVRGQGQLQGKVTVTPDNLSLVRQCCDNLDNVLLVVFMDSTAFLPYIVSEHDWNSATSQLSITCPQVGSWLYTRSLGPTISRSHDGTLRVIDRSYTWSQVDQLRIARDIITYATSEVGCPAIKIGSLASPRVRDLNFMGLSFKMAGDLLDTMSNRDDGFEWDVVVRLNEDRVPELFLDEFYPERNTSNNTLLFEYLSTGNGNISDISSVKKSASSRRSRVWATGQGTPPDQPVAMDTDPEVAAGFMLLRERVTAYSNVPNISTLASHARVERQALSPLLSLPTLTVRADNPRAREYGPGDRARVIIKDLWLDVDVPAARIVDRVIVPFNRQSGEAVGVTVDLDDFKMPSTDDGGDAG